MQGHKIPLDFDMTYSGTDFYCDVALKGLVEIKKEYESDNVLAFHHTQPHWPVHIVVVPKKHIESFLTLTENDMPVLNEMTTVIKNLASKIREKDGAARILTNVGTYQDSKHLHFHINSGEELL